MLVYLGVLAFFLSLLSVYGVYFAERPLSPAQKEALMGVAEDLRALQNRDITLSAPVETTISLDRSYPIKDLFPEEFSIPLEFNIPIDTQMIAVGSNGQPASFRVQESVPIKATIPIQSSKAFGESTIRIQKELPVEATFTSTVKVRAAYGQDLNKIIDKLETLAK